MNIAQLVAGIKALNDSELQELVSCLNNDWLVSEVPYVTTTSTMEAMIYAFNTSRAVVAQRDSSLRDQAASKW